MAKNVRGTFSPEQIQGDLRQGDSPIVLMAKGAFVAGNSLTTDAGGNAVDSGEPAGGGVASVFGRTGVVAAAAGDYPPSLLGTGTPDSTKYLRGDGTWETPPSVSPVTSVHGRTGAVVAVAGDYPPALLGTGSPDATKFLRGDGTWQVPSGGGAVSSVFGRTGAVVAAAGDYPPALLGTGTPDATKFLRGDGSWQVPASAPVDSVFGRTGVVVAALGDYPPALLGTGTPDSTKFLRGDGTWQVPPAGASSPTTTKGDLIARSATADDRLPIGIDGQVLTADAAQALGVKWAAAPYDVVASYVGKPGAAALVLILTHVRAVSFAANFSGSYGTVGVNPTASATYTVKKNGSSIGTVAVSTGGVFTFATSGGAAQAFAAGDRMTVEAPSPADTTLADVGLTFAGTR